eukprot:GAFH01003039.1.p1 GENE.GAFH01003039.1~~GAFH01003039.1.p1  ORF type:complete len:282 (+),score=20.49 GAFH01003039.1:134-979(+)
MDESPFTGRVFTFDLDSGFVAIESESKPSGHRRSAHKTESASCTYRICKMKFITQFVKVEDPRVPYQTPEDLERIEVNGQLEPKQLIDEGALEQRAAMAVAAALEKHARIGVGVSAETQQLFDAFCNMLPDCRWEGKNIVVNGVVITEPYDRSSCLLKEGGKRTALNQVQKMLDVQRRKIFGSSSGVATPSASPSSPTPSPPGLTPSPRHSPPPHTPSSPLAQHTELPAPPASSTPTRGTSGRTAPILPSPLPTPPGSAGPAAGSPPATRKPLLPSPTLNR